MAPRDDYRKISTFDFRPVFMSLDLPQSDFNTGTAPAAAKLFDAALNADAAHPDTLWLFKGSDFYSFNLRSGQFEGEARPIAGNWGGNTWPPMFSSGIDGAVWGGPISSTSWYFFKDVHYIRLKSALGGEPWPVEFGPERTGASWAPASDTWFGSGFDAALHTLNTKKSFLTHLFKGNEYMLVNLNGNALTPAVDGPRPLRDVWRLPEPFASKIDLAFYGTGAEEEHIFFFSGVLCAQFDSESGETLKVMPIEKRFPAFTQFMLRPQLFLVEDYRLETYVGPPQLGRLVETRNVPPGTETRTLMVTETVDSSVTTLRQSLLESQDASVVKNLDEQMDKRSSNESGEQEYSHHFQTGVESDARKPALWGGRVNNQGESDVRRSSFVDSAFESIGKQVTEAAQQLTQRTYESAAAIEHTERVLKQEEIVLKNPSDRLRVFEFYQQLQPYLTLIVLKSVRIAYADGSEPPRIVDLARLELLLDEKLPDVAARRKVADFLFAELSAVQDQDGQTQSLLQPTAQVPGQISLRPSPTSTFVVQHQNGDIQTIATKGLVIKGAKDWLAPTLTMIAVET